MSKIVNHVRGKMDKPAVDGEKDQILRCDGKGGVVWDDAATSQEIGVAVTGWMDENITGESTVIIDKSLAVSGAAADALAVHDAIENAPYVNGGFIENNALYLTHDGEVVAGPFSGIGGGGGGGGGGGNSAVLTLENTTGWAAATFAKDTDVVLTLNWSSIEDEQPTGDGVLTVLVNKITRATMNVHQGNISLNIKDYLITGSNAVSIVVMDSYENKRQKNFSISVLDMSVQSSFDETVIQTGGIIFQYTPYGNIEKTMHFILDGTQLETVVTSVSGRELTLNIPAQEHGAHSLRVYATASMNGNTFTSNVLYYEFISIEDGETYPAIASDYNPGTVSQYTTVPIPFMVYDPASQLTDVTVLVNGDIVGELTDLDRSVHTFTYRFDDIGEQSISFVCGTTIKIIVLTVTEVQIDVHAETENLALYLSSAGRNNSEPNPAVWTYGEGASQIAATFTGFNWTSDGWQQDSDGLTALRISGDARVTIPYRIFEDDFRTTGKTIEIEFATRDVRDYSETILSCMNGGRGISLTAQACSIASEQSSIGMQFKEEEHVRVAFVVDKRSGLRLVRCYINGVISGTTRYPYDDDFQQVSPVGITIGSNNCTVDVYCIRVYDNNLNSQQIEDNWIADTQNGALMLERYNHNNIRDEYGNVVISKLPSDLPYFVIVGPTLPQYKGDKKTCSGYFINPENPAKNFTFTGAQIDVQGTSSQYYARKNYKLKFKNGFVDDDDEVSAKYKMRDDSIAVNTFCFKADVASSEGANNVILARLYDDTCTYKTPAQVQNNKVRQGIDGFPMVVFWNNSNTGEMSFLGKYNFNNDKGTADVFGFVSGDESWEVRNNTSNRVIFKDDDFTDDGWLNDFEARYPDTDPAFEDPAQLAEFVAWVRSTDPLQASDDELPDPATYDGVEYTTDSVAYRKAKFKNELGNYVEVNSAIFYYLFTELFLMVDSRAKNMFPSFMGGVINE